MDGLGMKEVFFNEYCVTCKYKEEPEYCDECNECLNNPFQEYSHKPKNWEEAK